MNEGQVVIVVDHISNRIKDIKDEDRVGTLVYIDSNVAIVLLSNGDIWTGNAKMVHSHQT